MTQVVPTPDPVIDALVIMALRTCQGGSAQEQIRAFVRLLEAEIEARLRHKPKKRMPDYGKV